MRLIRSIRKRLERVIVGKLRPLRMLVAFDGACDVIASRRSVLWSTATTAIPAPSATWNPQLTDFKSRKSVPPHLQHQDTSFRLHRGQLASFGESSR